MSTPRLSVKTRLKALGKQAEEAGMRVLAHGALGVLRMLGSDRSRRYLGALARRIGPHLHWHKIAMANAQAVFPDKTPAEIERLVLGAWENFGAIAAEYSELDRMFGDDPARPGAGRIEVEGTEHVLKLRDDGKPGLIFLAHLGNWELPALLAARCGLDAAFLARPPDWRIAGRIMDHARQRARSREMFILARGAGPAIKEALDAGRHVAMNIDQHFGRGVVVTVLGRPALINPAIATFARLYACPVVGMRAIRLDGGRFRIEVTAPLDLPRDADGEVDVQAATEAMIRIVERWVLEHPAQWMWMHPLWRLEAALLATGGWPHLLSSHGRLPGPT